MEDYTAPVSVSQPFASGNDEDRISPSFSASGGGSPNSETPDMKTVTLDQHQEVPPENPTKKRRGRPQGSKNKPKPPIPVTGDSGFSPMKTVILEIPPGSDVIERVVSFACRNHVGVGILSATGFVSNVSLFSKPLEPASIAKGTYELHSLIGSFFPECIPSSSNGTPGRSSSTCPSFRVTLQVPPQFQLIGGRVVGKLTAATHVNVVAAVLANPSFDNFPSEHDKEDPLGQQTRACNVNGPTGNFPSSSTCMAMDAYRVSNPAAPPSNVQFSHLTALGLEFFPDRNQQGFY